MDGGTLFFVVYIDKENGNVLQIYYTALLPIRIMELFKSKKNSYVVLFDKFPKDNDKKIEIVFDAYANAQRQKSYAGTKLPTIDELSSQGILESISIHVTHFGKSITPRNVPQIMEGKSLTIYANIKGSPIGIPVEHYENITHVKTSQEFEKAISVNGEVYYDRYRVIYSSTEVETIIGSCLAFTSPALIEVEKDSVPVTIKFNIKGTLKEQIKGIKFILAISKHNGFEIGSLHFPVQLAKKEEAQKLNGFNERLNELEYIQAILHQMHVGKDFLIEDCDEEDKKNLRLLLRAIGENKPVQNIPPQIESIYKLKISNLLLGVVYVKHPDGYYYMHDYFGNHLEAYWNVAGNKMRISQYAVMNAEDFMQYDNLYLPIILEDFKLLPVSYDMANHANLLMLEMIKAFDQCMDATLLEYADKINDWLLTYPQLIDHQICDINHYQIIARQRELLLSEKVELLSIVENTDNKIYKAGALILLGDTERVKRTLSLFSESELNDFCKYPIYSLLIVTDSRTS